MITKLEILKALFDEFLNEAHLNSVDRLENKERIKLNAQVFELQAHIAFGLKSFDLNIKLNPVIHSENIKSSFDEDSKPFSPNDYCLSFFDFLNTRQDAGLELFELIDNFIEFHKDELSWQDIVITATGATRCKTNIRFALDRLRRIGLIRKIDDAGGRVYIPTLLGELVFYCWRKSIHKDRFKENLFDNDIKIKDACFSKLFSVLTSITKNNSIHIDVATWAVKKDQKATEVEDLMTNVKVFLERSVITEDGIFLTIDK